MIKVFVNGTFDVIHFLHIKLLQYAKSLGDELIVAINSDDSVKRLKGASRPFNNEQDRKKVLEAIMWVDKVVIFKEDDASHILKLVRPNIVVKGSDYNINNINVREKKVLDKIGGKFVFIEYNPNYSSTYLINKMTNENN